MISFVALALSAAAPGIAGDWVTNDRSAVVRIERCGARLCGRIVRVLARGKPATDVHNPINSLRRRPIVGLTVLSGFSSAGTGGRAYDPETGRSYRSALRLNADGSLRVTGCVTIVCRSRNWTRR